MSARERPFDRGTRLGRAALVRVGQELRDARVDRSLTVDTVALAVGVSNAEVSRIERALSPKVPHLTLYRLAAVVGLDLVSRLYAGPAPVRDAAQIKLLADFRAALHRSLGWATEVPLPAQGDQRAWDAVVSGGTWRYGVEGETLPRDAQGLLRRLNLKARDGQVDGVILALRDSRRSREFIRAAADELTPAFPIAGVRASELLRAGANPGGSALVLVPRTPAEPPADRRSQPALRRT
jgi:transcriptional regulator with XRE-family HTH domain